MYETYIGAYINLYVTQRLHISEAKIDIIRSLSMDSIYSKYDLWVNSCRKSRAILINHSK